MKEIPIDLYEHERKALAEGRLGLIVRPVEPQPFPDGEMWGHAQLGGLFAAHVFPYCFKTLVACPLGQPGDRLIVGDKVLEVTDVKVKRVQACTMRVVFIWGSMLSTDKEEALDFENLWNSLFPATPYAENPWAWLVWIKEIKR